MEIEDVIKNKDDKEFVLKAVQEKGKLLEFASERLQNDKEVVIEALKQDGEAAEFISDELKDDKEDILQEKVKDRIYQTRILNLYHIFTVMP